MQELSNKKELQSNKYLLNDMNRFDQAGQKRSSQKSSSRAIHRPQAMRCLEPVQEHECTTNSNMSSRPLLRKTKSYKSSVKNSLENMQIEDESRSEDGNDHDERLAALCGEYTQNDKNNMRLRSYPSASSITRGYTARDYALAKSILKSSMHERTEMLRQRQQVSFGNQDIELERTFRTDPSKRVQLDLDSPPSSPHGHHRGSNSFISNNFVDSAKTAPADLSSLGSKSSSCAHSSQKSGYHQLKQYRGNDVHHQISYNNQIEQPIRNQVTSMASPIHEACRKGEYLAVKYLLSFYYGSESSNLVNSVSVGGQTPLHVACEEGHTKIAQLLLRRHAMPNLHIRHSKKKRQRSCLALACKRGNVELVNLLLEYGAHIDEDAFLFACKVGSVAIVRTLMLNQPKKSNINPENDGLRLSNSMDAGTFLVNRGATVACIHGHTEVVSVLLGENTQNSTASSVAFCAIYAVMQEDDSLLRCLISLYGRRVILATRDDSNCSLLHRAVAHAEVNCTQLLLEMGADVHAVDGRQITPLYIACARGRTATVELLLKAGALSTGMGPNNETPLHIAAQENHVACVNALLTANKTCVDALTKDHCTALHLACQRGNTMVAASLLKHGANVNALTLENETPLIKASRMSHVETVKLLVEYTAASPQFKEPVGEGNASSEIASDADDIFIAKTNTHTTMKQWLRSVLKTN